MTARGAVPGSRVAACERGAHVERGDSRISLPISALLFVTGAVAAQAMPAVPDARGVAIGLVFGFATLAASLRFDAARRARSAAACLVGFCWALLHAGHAMSARWPFAGDGASATLTVDVLDLPRVAADHVRFDARNVATGARIKLSWFDASAPPQPGERLTLTAKMRRPRGTLNPGAFDFERHAAERGIVAVGSVRAVQARDATLDALPWTVALRARVDRSRDRFARAVVARLAADESAPPRDRPHEHTKLARPDVAKGKHDRIMPPRIERRDHDAPDATRTAAALVRALAVGDTRGLADSDWRWLRATGTTHLVAISGLHVGLVASLGVLIARIAYRMFPGLGSAFVRPRAEALLALFVASGYAVLAGGSLPVLRTLLMIAVVAGARFVARATHLTHLLAVAAVSLVAADPLAVLAPGFWLSFAGVAWLAYCLDGRSRLGWALGFLRAQGAASLALVPLTLWFFGQTTLVGPLANLVAVPWISFVCVPLALVAYALHACGLVQAAGVAIDVATHALAVMVAGLERLAALPHAELHAPTPSAWALVLATIGIAWMLAPSGLPGRALGLVLVLPIAAPVRDAIATGELRVDVLDVGQGLAVLVRTSEHALLYDTGPASGEHDAGDSIVVPALHALSVRRLDALVVSHRDNDHAGGADAVIAAFAPPVRFRGSDTRDRRCAAGDGWRWDGVVFRWLHPPPHFPPLGNDASCVLAISSGATRILLPGDIGAVVESRLVATLDAHALVVAAHHGSRTSSSEAFVEATAPAAVAYARGWRHRHGHPAPSVVRRYAAHGAERHDTAVHGHLAFRFDTAGGSTVTHARTVVPRWWREPALVE